MLEHEFYELITYLHRLSNYPIDHLLFNYEQVIIEYSDVIRKFEFPVTTYDSSLLPKPVDKFDEIERAYFYKEQEHSYP